MTKRDRLRLNSLTKWLMFAGITTLLVIGAAHFNLAGQIQGLLQVALSWVQSLGPIGILVYIGIYNLATVLFIPGSLLTLGGGAIYGVVWGSIYVFAAATLGATLAFMIGRYISRDWVNARVAQNDNFRAIEAAVAREGFKIVLLTRLSPLFPFNLLNYAFGITQVSLKDYVLGSVGMIPGTIMYVYIGSLAGDLANLGSQPNLSPQAQAIGLGLRLLGLAATILVTLYITHIAKQALAHSVNNQP